MTSRIDIEKPQKIEVTVTMTTTLAEWKVLRDALDKAENRGANPLWELRRQLDELLNDLERQCITKYTQKEIP